jgi:hypothetical protein
VSARGAAIVAAASIGGISLERLHLPARTAVEPMQEDVRIWDTLASRDNVG